MSNELEDPKTKALRLAITHIEHLSAWIAKQNRGYSFESLSEDISIIQAAATLPSPTAGEARVRIAGTMNRLADRLSQVGEFLVGLTKDDPVARSMYARLVGVQSFLRLDAEEIETGLCGCRHVPDDEEQECARCGGTGKSEFAVLASLPASPPGKGVVELRAALAPFAKLAEVDAIEAERFHSRDDLRVLVTLGDCRRAARALSTQGGDAELPKVKARFNPATCPHCEYDRRFPGFERGGWLQQENNGPIVSCPMCNDDGKYPREVFAADLHRHQHGPFHHVTQNEKDLCDVCNRPHPTPGRELSGAEQGEPVAWTYVIATVRHPNGAYGGWDERLTFSKPNVPEASIKDLKPLFALAASPSPNPNAREWK